MCKKTVLPTNKQTGGQRFTRPDPECAEPRRVLPALPGGGGAEAGRVSVERLTAVTDRSATGISEDSLAALITLLPRPWSLPTTLRPWSVLPGARVQRRQAGRAGSSQVKLSQPGRAGRASQRSLNGAMQAIRSPRRQVIIRHASVLPHTAYCASLARPRHARSRVRPNQVKSSQVQVTSGVPPVCHARAAMGRAWPMPRAHAPPRHAPRPP